MINYRHRETFSEQGFLVINDLLNTEEVTSYRKLYEDFLAERIDTQGQRSDLSGQTQSGESEKITQIMRPSLLHPPLLDAVIHQRTKVIAQELLGEDMDLDFDMLIDKAPFTNTLTPWHQDEAYWINMPDKRAVSCWVALDDVIKENGCMWYVPGSHRQPLRTHRQTGQGGALECNATEAEANAIEIPAGSCVLHHGRTIHYARGNTTAHRRRAFITNFRPTSMIAFEREHGFDHTGKRKVRQ